MSGPKADAVGVALLKGIAIVWGSLLLCVLLFGNIAWCTPDDVKLWAPPWSTNECLAP